MIFEKLLSDIEPKEIVKGFKARFVHTDTLTVSFWEVEAGAELPLHHHINEQVSHILEGEFEMTIDGETKVYSTGSIMVIPSNIEHSGKAITPCRILDIFNPAREDYK